ncbi:MAG: DUF2207 domain-containing protein [Streptococcaceae bacterium]|jgi:uncharacterized membrane protein|nr:DUF2207 domain-containing protein [Streptococcaceae bacterium]
MNIFTSKTWVKIATAFVVIFALLFGGLTFLRMGMNSSNPDGPSYRITNYQGNLTLKDDNTATYVMHLTYQFDSSFNGQSVTFGKAGKVPKGFNPQLQNVTASVNGQNVNSADLRVETADESDAIVTKIYNAGSAGDKVNLTLTYQIANMLWAYSDIFMMNWVPISDWDVPLKNISFTVTAPEDVKTSLQPQLGYLNQKVTAVKSGKSWTFKINQIPARSDLNILARWDSQAFTSFSKRSPSSVDKTAYLKNFNKKADSIVQDSTLINLSVYFVAPILIGLLIIFFIYRAVSFVRRITPKTALDDKLRLYEVPEDLTPLLVASHVYSCDADELSPTANSEPISFKNLMMATITDLIDRGALSVDGETLKWTGSKELLPSEEMALALVMGNREQINFDEAFQDFKMGAYYSSKEAERSAGRAVKSNFDREVKQLASAVRSDIAMEKLPNFFRKLTPRENNHLFFNSLMLYVLPIISIVLLILTVNKTYLTHSFLFDSLLIAEISIAFPVAFVLSAISMRLSRDGVVTAEGAQAQLQWNAFARMLREIAHLDDNKLESIKIWNRLLVFATMFGYADKVIKLINTHGIQLSGNLNNTNFGFYYPFYMGFGANLNSTVQGFTSASNINIDTGGGGFSSGGGFSGGGGGGGGGAF